MMQLYQIFFCEKNDKNSAMFGASKPKQKQCNSWNVKDHEHWKLLNRRLYYAIYDIGAVKGSLCTNQSESIELCIYILQKAILHRIFSIEVEPTSSEYGTRLELHASLVSCYTGNLVSWYQSLLWTIRSQLGAFSLGHSSVSQTSLTLVCEKYTFSILFCQLWAINLIKDIYKKNSHQRKCYTGYG